MSSFWQVRFANGATSGWLCPHEVRAISRSAMQLKQAQETTSATTKIAEHQHTLTFAQRNARCDICGKDCGRGTYTYYCAGCDFDACQECVASRRPSSVTAAFRLNQRVKCKDSGDSSWKQGVVTSVSPLKVQCDGWDDSFTWDQVEPATIAPPKYLRLDGGKELAPHIAADYLGYYELDTSQQSHGRAVWKHASSESCLWYNTETHFWMGGKTESIGSNSGHLFVRDTCESPDRASHHWEAHKDGSWVEQPTLKCTAPASIPQVKVGSCVEVVSGSDAGRTGKVVEDDGTSNPYKVTALHTAPHSIEATGPTPEPHELFLAGALC